MSEDEITHWIAKAQGGDEAAAGDIWNAYYSRLISYARKKLTSMPRRSVDEEDVVLSAMNSFFDGVQKERFLPKDRDELWKLLATITVRKATAQLRKHNAAKRGGGKVRGESIFVKAGEQDGGFGIGDVLDDKRLPQMSLELAATCEEMLESLDDETQRKIAVMRLEGFGNTDIASELDVSLATVKRKLKRIRDLWDNMAPGSTD